MLIAILALGIGFAAGLLAHAQPPDASPKPAAPLAGPPAPEGAPLDTYYLRDSKGQLVPVPGFTYEEFEQLLRLKRGLAAPPPPEFSLDAVTISGTVEKGVADLAVTATIRVRDPGWVRVPLALRGASLRQPAKHEGPGEHFLTVDSQAGGYIAWLKGADAKPHVVTLQVSVATVQAGAESRLSLSVPRATESTLRITVPVARAEASLLAGEGIVTATSKGMGKSEISLLGPAGDLQLAWLGGREPAATGPALLEASGDIAIKIESESRVSSDARLRVRSLGAAIETFRVRLPPGMELVPTSPTGYSVTVVEQPVPAGGKPADQQLVEVQLPRPTTGQTEVRLLATSSADVNRLAAFQPARFDVQGAVRQRGTIEATIEGEWQLGWKEDGSVRRLDVGADTALARLAARYEYSRQPCGLALKVSARPSRVSVEPTHIVYVDGQQARIESTLKYRFRGARVTGLEFDLAGWKLDRIVPADMFEIVPSPADGGKLIVPVSSGVTLPSELELKLEGHQPLDAASGSLSLRLPHPVADVVSPATIVIAPADNIELSPRSSGMQGLSPDTSTTSLKIAGRQQPPLVYRDLGGGEPAAFAADVLVRRQSITAGARATVRLAPQQMQVEQRLDYRIAYEPRRSLEILVPRNVLTSGRLEVLLADEPLTPVPVTEAATEGETVRLAVVAPADQIGLCQLVCRYALPLPRWDRQKSQTLAVPLVIPAEMPNLQIGGQQIEFLSDEGWQLDPDTTHDDEFSRPTPTSTAGSPISYAWSRAKPMSHWKVLPPEANRSVAAAVHKAWVQTWLAGGVRQERAVFRVTANQEQLRVKLSGSPSAGSIQAAVNAQPAPVAVREPAALLVDLPPAVHGGECVVELWYALPESQSHSGILTTELRAPQVEGASAPRRMFWQLCLPDDEYLLVPPDEYAAEMTWGWADWLLGRRPILGQEELEAWIGASRQDALPKTGSTYLFSTLGRQPTLSFTLAGRRLLLFAASGLALVVGLVLLNVRAARRPEALLATALILAALALAWPDAAVLLAQAAAAGVAVTAALALGIWLTAGRTIWPATTTPIPVSPAPEARSTELPAARPDRVPQTTATAPAALAAAEPHP
jgi:hypothetical protein